MLIAAGADVNAQDLFRKSALNYARISGFTLLEQKETEVIGPSSFIVHGLIGKGSFGEVYLVQRKGGSNVFAMKVL